MMEYYVSSDSFVGIASAADRDHPEILPTRTLFDLEAHPASRFLAPDPDGKKFYAVTYGPGSDYLSR